ncbi:MAG TPA: type II restriction endonuclease subunit R, partial [Armatimonadetes bacterium]|nr:type II restriction endonuclease subunit R [Armatimonadota bacterium]
IKIVWTVDWQKAEEFCRQFKPRCDILLAQVNWGKEGGLFLIPLEAQMEVFSRLGKERYLRVPKRGTNPRGIEISGEALRELLSHESTRRIPIKWEKRPIEPLEPYKRWLDYWREK